MTYAEVLALLRLEDRMDVPAAVRSGSCTVTFDHNIDVTLEMVPTPPGGMPSSQDAQLLLHTSLGALPKAQRETAFARLLQLHLFGVATGQGVFGFDDLREEVLFFRHIPLGTCDPDSCIAALHGFIEHARRWRETLPALQLPSQASSFTSENGLERMRAFSDV